MPENKQDSPENDVLSWTNMQANYSALMYLITEQQALIGKLLEELMQNQALNSRQVENITNIYGNSEVLNPVYSDLYRRFAEYYLRIKDVLTNPEDYQPPSPFPESPKNNPENPNDNN